jgi:hypothetical protein
MRTRRFNHSFLLSFGLASVATAGACGHEEGGAGSAAASAEALASEASGSTAIGSDRITELTRRKVDRQQLVALLGDNVPADVGAACSPIGSTCLPDENAVVVPCGGFQGACDSTGTQVIRKIHFFCLPGGGGNTCTAVADQVTETVSCTVPTDGKACTTGCGPEFCSPYANSCDAETDRVRVCHTGGTCLNDQCVNETTVTEVTGTCERETEGDSCSPSEVRPIGSPCGPFTSPICDPGHVCRCLTGPL